MSENPQRKLSIVIPVFNERKHIEQTLKKVQAVDLPLWKKEIIVVDDGSTDGTREILGKLSKEIKVIFRSENGGKGAALKDGFRAATGDYILIQDADGEYDPNDFPKLLKPIEQGKVEVVFGSRVLSKNNVPFSRIYFYGGLLVTKIFNLLFGNGITDLATCYKVFSRKYVDEIISMQSNDFAFDVVELSYVLLSRVGHITEVPIAYNSRHKEEGKKMNWRYGMRCLWRISSLFLTEKIFRSRGYLPVLLTFALFFAVFFQMYFSVTTLVSSDDHYFHFRFAEQMTTKGFFESFTDFKSLYFSKMAQGNEYFVYYNFLFYLVAIPFTFITPLYLGIKLYAVFAAAFAFALLYYCLKKVEIRNPFIWILIIIAITETSAVWRFFLSRPYALAPSLLLLLLVFLYKKNYLGIFLLSAIYLFWHSATFFMPLGVVAVYFVIEKFYREKSDYKIVLYSFLGTALAVALTYAVSPGFITYMKEIIFGTYFDTILGKKVEIMEGGELYPLDFFNVIQANALIFAAFVTAISVDIYSYVAFRSRRATPEEYFLGVSEKRRHVQTTVVVLTALFFLGAVAASARFGDYFTMFAGLYIALSFDYMRRTVKISGSVVMRKGIIAASVIVLTYLFVSSILFLQQKVARGSHPLSSHEIGLWLHNNAGAGEVVFITDWSWFTQLYYADPRLNYIFGLEPRFMYVYDPKLYWQWVHISRDGYACAAEKCPELSEKIRDALKTEKGGEEWAAKEGDRIADVLRKDFHSSIVVSSTDYRALNYIMEHNKNFDKGFYNAEFGFNVFRIVNATSSLSAK